MINSALEKLRPCLENGAGDIWVDLAGEGGATIRSTDQDKSCSLNVFVILSTKRKPSSA